MKALRYLLIVMMLSAASAMFAAAQSLAQQPKAEMKSTSGMVYSGSNLPSAAASGAVVTGSKLGTYAPANATSNEGPRKAKRGIDDDDEEEKPGGWDDPMYDPIGDAMLPLMLLALAYMGVRAFLRRKRA